MYKIIQMAQENRVYEFAMGALHHSSAMNSVVSVFNLKPQRLLWFKIQVDLNI